MATYTAGDQINRALRMLGVLAEGETPSASVSNDALVALNQMIDSWNTENLSIFSTTDQTIVWPASQATRTLGPSGNLPGTNTRPVSLSDATYYVVNGISYVPAIIGDQQYAEIPLKTILSPYPSVMYVNDSYPDMTLTLYPVPSQALTFHFIGPTPLDQPATLATVITFPPGYLRAFVYNLALEIAPEFGVDPAKDIRRIAASSKHDIMRINSPIDVLQMPDELAGGPRANIFVGN